MGTFHAWETYGDGVSVRVIHLHNSIIKLELFYSPIFKPLLKDSEGGESSGLGILVEQ